MDAIIAFSTSSNHEKGGKRLETQKARFIIIVCISFFILLVSCDTTKIDWEKAKKINTFESYKEFIEQHPFSEYSSQAHKEIEWIISIQKLEDNNKDVQIEGIRRLYRMEDSRAVDPLIRSLKHKNPDVRGAAVSALGEIKDSRAVEPLIEMLKDKDWFIRNEAVEALGEIKTLRAIEPVIDALLRDKDSRVRMNSATALGKIKDIRAIEPLIQALKDNTAGVRCHAAQALGEIKDSRAAEPLINALRNNLKDDYCCQDDIVEALRKIHPSNFIEPSIVALKNKNSRMREEAALILGAIKDPRAVEHLIEALGDKDLNVRYRSAWALGEIDDFRANKTLTDGLKKKNFTIIVGAYSFFIRKGIEGSETILFEALKKYGDSSMAMDFMNCGNNYLASAAEKWAKSKGLEIIRLSGVDSKSPKWGSR